MKLPEPPTCATCGAEITADAAITVEFEEGVYLYFCSDDCAADHEYRPGELEPNRDERR